MESLQNIKARIKKYFETKPVSKAYIFGSFARNENTEQSDLDILGELEKGVDLFYFAKMKIELEKELKNKVDLISINGLSPYIKPFIDRDKILIYAK